MTVSLYLGRKSGNRDVAMIGEVILIQIQLLQISLAFLPISTAAQNSGTRLLHWQGDY